MANFRKAITKNVARKMSEPVRKAMATRDDLAKAIYYPLNFALVLVERPEALEAAETLMKVIGEENEKRHRRRLQFYGEE